MDYAANAIELVVEEGLAEGGLAFLGDPMLVSSEVAGRNPRRAPFDGTLKLSPFRVRPVACCPFSPGVRQNLIIPMAVTVLFALV